MTTKTRQKYRFTLNFPNAFTVKQLMQRGNHPSYITAHKRVEAALAAGQLKVAGKFRDKVRKGRMQTVYVRTNVENVMLELESAKLTKGDLVLTQAV